MSFVVLVSFLVSPDSADFQGLLFVAERHYD